MHIKFQLSIMDHDPGAIIFGTLIVHQNLMFLWFIMMFQNYTSLYTEEYSAILFSPLMLLS